MAQQDSKPITDEVIENPIKETNQEEVIPYDEITNPSQHDLDVQSREEGLEAADNIDSVPDPEDDINPIPNPEDDTAITEDPDYMRTNPKVVGYDTIEEQEIIYDYMLSNFNPITDSILDVGCGRGDFLRHIENAYQTEVDYKGVDMNPQLIEVAEELSPSAKFTTANWFDLDGNYAAQWVVNIQSSTILYEDPGEDFDQVQGLRNTISKMLELADQGIIISLLSTLAPEAYGEEYLVYDPVETLDWALNEYGAIGGNVKLDHSMTDAIFTLTIYK